MSLYSYKYKFIFIHVPKNAGSTFENNYSACLPKGELLHFENLNEMLGHERDPALGNHFTYQMISDLTTRHSVPLDLDSAYKFCVVRNPWERMVSLYEHRLRKIDRLTNGVPRNSPEDKEMLRSGFENWLRNTQNISDVVLTRMPQIAWIRDRSGKIVCDRIIRIENYDTEIQEVAAHVGLPQIDMPRRNTSTKDSSSYRSYYSRPSEELVAQRFAEDIEAFGFSF